MKKLIIPLLIVTVNLLNAPAAYSQNGANELRGLIDSLAAVAEQGLSIAYDYDTLQKYHAKIYNDYIDVLKQNLAFYEADSIARVDKRNMQRKLNDARDSVITYMDKFNGEHKKKNKAWGISVIPVSYDFIVRRVTFAQVGLTWTPKPFRFSLSGLFADGQGVEVPDQNIRVIK